MFVHRLLYARLVKSVGAVLGRVVGQLDSRKQNESGRENDLESRTQSKSWASRLPIHNPNGRLDPAKARRGGAAHRTIALPLPS